MVNKIILGTVQFGLEYGINNSNGKPEINTVFSILDCALDNDIMFLDTAEAYGNSQELIGEYHKKTSKKFEVITKFSAKRTDLSCDLSERIIQNLNVLNIDSLYGYMFHSFNDFENYYPRFENKISDLKKTGLIQKFGVSIYTNEELEKLLTYNGIDFVQLPFNVLDNTYQRSTLIKKAKQKGIEVHTRSVFLQGLFFKTPDTLPEKLISLKSYLHTINAISASSQISINDVSLNYAVSKQEIDYVLIGVDTVNQLQENIHSLQTKIPSAVFQQIDDIHVKEVELLNPANWNK